MTYGAWFFDTIREPVRAGAAALVPVVYDHLDPKPKTVVDVGCGQGWWALAFAELGCDVTGVDGDYVPTPALGDRFIAADLEQPLPDLGQFDLAVSLEVAEHLTEARAETFVADLCALAPVVLFSAAIPGQGGTGHIHCRWPSYWAELFAANGYDLDGSIRYKVWADERIEPWYRQNLHVATKGGTATTLDLVHPGVWGR